MIAAATALCVACGDSKENEALVEIADVYPGAEWATGDPEDHGIDPDKLQDAADVAEGLDSHCFMVIHRGTVVGRWYWDGWDEDTRQDIFSASKSITSTLFGIAQARGLLDVDDLASDTITEWQGTDSEDVTIGNLLSNDSGREWTLFGDYLEMITTADDKTRYSIELGQDHPPGEYWEYNNSAIQTLQPILEQAVGMSVDEFAREALFEPIGMDDAEYSIDNAGNAIMWGGVQASCDDLARLGLLFLRRGVWADEEEIVPTAWVDVATTPRTDHNSAYGYLWWLNREGHWIEPSGTGTRTEGDGRWHPGDPEEVYLALGFQGQMVVVDPTRELVYARIGGDEDMIAALTGGSGGLLDLSNLAGGVEVTDIREAVRAALLDE